VAAGLEPGLAVEESVRLFEMNNRVVGAFRVGSQAIKLLTLLLTALGLVAALLWALRGYVRTLKW
jgi:hypothetical protein